jgi:hypothetical protein
MELGFIACLWGYLIIVTILVVSAYLCCSAYRKFIIIVLLLSRACSIYPMDDAKFICFLSRMIFLQPRIRNGQKTG